MDREELLQTNESRRLSVLLPRQKLRLEKIWQQFFKRNTDPFLSCSAGSILTAELKLFEQNQLAKLGYWMSLEISKHKNKITDSERRNKRYSKVTQLEILYNQSARRLTIFFKLQGNASLYKSSSWKIRFHRNSADGHSGQNNTHNVGVDKIKGKATCNNSKGRQKNLRLFPLQRKRDFRVFSR